ncbi:hypothetical protein B9G53_17415 [Pseudanabaena sp. SR411]|nr:hypothetical protein B9G53_17415 [Pseudanabaena sp. SR411]
MLLFCDRHINQYIAILQQLPIKRTTRDFLKVLLRNTFKKSLGLGLSAKRYKSFMRSSVI